MPFCVASKWPHFSAELNGEVHNIIINLHGAIRALSEALLLNDSDEHVRRDSQPNLIPLGTVEISAIFVCLHCVSLPKAVDDPK